ncbi:hypothetical protein D3C73_1626670 [compost metagenome]
MWPSARSGSLRRDFLAGAGVLGSNASNAMKAAAMRTAVPKKGARHCQPPNRAPSRGPSEMPRPRAAS